ncbi:protein of unknown function [Pseudodesulfovibrio profundus]|uniref:Uncharacterized protein n=1 Tax=Pseudodesulfovibrio profundus TaxID=57320 RepID=A0A2C8F980_9BACT|nr:protein of unknown function [Pseudodesulfovibrio profundus]
MGKASYVLKSSMESSTTPQTTDNIVLLLELIIPDFNSLICEYMEQAPKQLKSHFSQ